MNSLNGAFALLQKIGKALMLPVSVLPVAGILLGVGAAEFSWLPTIVSQLMMQAGGTIFGCMPLIEKRWSCGTCSGRWLRRVARNDGRDGQGDGGGSRHDQVD
jgi:Phosphotransferase system, EIIC